MASTYVNDLRLEEMATGDQSGTWGDTTNTNLELIAEAFSYGTQASFGSDADATTTIADGASDPARSLYLKITSGVSLTATRTLTIAPNTVSKIWIIENATSGSQSINISQGSGANVTIPSGDVKVIYTDGAGSGAAVVDAFTDLNLSGTTTVAALDAGSGAITTTGTVTGNTLAGTLSTAAQPNITSVGTLTSLTGGTGDLNWDSGTLFVDSSANAVGVGTTSPAFENGNGLEIRNSSGNGAHLKLTDNASGTGGTQGFDLYMFNSQGYIENYENAAIVFRQNGGESARFDASGNLLVGKTATGGNTAGMQIIKGSFFSHVRDGGVVQILNRKTDDGAILQFEKDNLTVGSIGTVTQSGATNLFLDSDSAVYFDTNARPNTDNTYDLGSGTYGWKDLYLSGTAYIDTAVGIGDSSPAAKLEIKQGSSNWYEGIRINKSDLTTQFGTFSNNSGATFIGAVDSTGGDNNVIVFGNSTDGTTFSQRMRIESDGNVGIGNTVAPSMDGGANNLVVGTGSGTEGMTIYSGTSNSGTIYFADGASGDDRFRGQISYSHSDNAFSFRTNASASANMTIDSSGNVGIGTTSSSGSSVKLEAHDATNPIIQVKDTTSNIICGIQAGNSEAVIRCPQDSPLVFNIGASETERMRIASNGRTSIGTTTTNAGLTVANADIRCTGAAIANDANSISMSQEASGSFITSRGSGGATKGTISLSVNEDDGGGGIVALKVENTAKVIIGRDGETGAVGVLEVRDDGADPIFVVHKNSTGVSDAVRIRHGRGLSGFSGTGISFRRNDDTQVGSVVIGFTSTAYNTTSDYRLKENVNYTWDATTRLKQLRPARFNFIEETGTTVDGFLAHEVQDIVPQAVTGEKDAVDGNGNPEHQSIDHSKLVPLLVKTIQELEARITALES